MCGFLLHTQNIYLKLANHNLDKVITTKFKDWAKDTTNRAISATVILLDIIIARAAFVIVAYNLIGQVILR